MEKTKWEKMRTASYLLPDPGGEVVRECLAQLDAERQKNKTLNDEYVDVAAEMTGAKELLKWYIGQNQMLIKQREWLIRNYATHNPHYCWKLLAKKFPQDETLKGEAKE